MKRKIGWILMILGMVAVLAELLGIQLPTLRWPFNTARDISFLHVQMGEVGEIGKLPIFGYVVCFLVIGLGYYLVRTAKNKPVSPVTQRRIQRFKEIRRGYISLIIIILLSLFASLDHLVVGNKALIVSYEGELKFPAFVREVYQGKDFGREGDAALLPADFRELDKQLVEESKGWVIMPLVPYNPAQDTVDIPVKQLDKKEDGKLYHAGTNRLFSGLASTLYDPDDASSTHIRHRYRKGLKDGNAEGRDRAGKAIYKADFREGKLVDNSVVWSSEGDLDLFQSLVNEAPYEILYFPSPPNKQHLLGTDSSGNDLLAYLFGGLQLNFQAALFFIPAVYFIGVSVGLLMGYFGGAFDLIVQRLIEIFSNVPLLFVLIIISSAIPEDQKGLGMILLILLIFGWMGMTYLMRTAAYREKERDYVAASRVLGASTPRILFRHILPNTVAILVTLIPFSVSGLVMSLTSLDYLGFGLPTTYATWGTLLKDGLENLSSPWLVTSAVICLVSLLILITFVGEAVREAFDPKKYTFYR